MQAGGPSVGDILGWVKDAGTIGVLVIILWGAGQEWWVTGIQYRRVLRERDDELDRARIERDDYKRELFNVLGLTDRAARTLDRATDRVFAEREPHEQRISRLEAQRDVRKRPPES